MSINVIFNNLDECYSLNIWIIEIKMLQFVHNNMQIK